MAEQGKITISVGVDSGEAIDGLKDLQDGLKGMGKTSGKAGGQVVDAFDEIDKAAKDSAKAVDKGSTSAQKAMKQTAKVAEKSGKQTKEALDQADTIDGLDGLKDKAGDLDSSLKGLGGAAGLLSPELERVLFVTGELSGGIEHTSRLTSFFGGSMGSLLRVAGPVGVAIGGLALTYNKLSGDLREAEERLDASHEAMVEGIAQAKAYEARMRSVRVTVGLLSQEEANLRNARQEATEALQHRNDYVQAARERLSVLNIAIKKNRESLSSARTASGSYQLSIVSATEAMDEAGKAARGEADGLDMVTLSAGKIRSTFSQITKETERMEHAARLAQNTINDYNETLDENQAILLIGQAITSREIEQMVSASEHLEQLTDDTRDRVEAQLLGAIASEQAAEAADKEAKAVERASRATTEAANEEREAEREAEAERRKAEAERRKAEEAAKALADARETAADKLASARGDAALIERDYARAIMEVNALQAQGAITEEDMTELVIAAYQRRGEAIEELARQREEANEAEKLGLADYAKSVTAVQQLTGNALALMSEDIDQREAEALARAEGNQGRQEEIRKEFDAERSAELTRLFKVNQAASIASAVMSGAQAATAALALPPVGFGPALGLAMIPVIAANTAAQVALIAQQKPSFHQGGIIEGQGDQPIMAQAGEVVLSRSAVASMGGAEAANQLNNGGSGPGRPVVVQMTYKNRVFDQIVVDNLAKGGPLKNALNRATNRGKRGRVGGRL